VNVANGDLFSGTAEFVYVFLRNKGTQTEYFFWSKENECKLTVSYYMINSD